MLTPTPHPATTAPGPGLGIGTKILATTDPDGWKYVLLDEEDFNKELA
jgi:lactoylglutathione lyase